MSPPKDGRLCARLTREELDATYFYPGPQNVGQKPGRRVQRRWDAAKEMCLNCPIFISCREGSWGEDYGVWGGSDQYERYLYRRRKAAALARLSAGERAALAARFAARYAGGAGESAASIARREGYSSLMVRQLLREHREAVEARRQELRTQSLAARGAVGIPGPPSTGRRWPEGAPDGDAWVNREGSIHSARYVGQSMNGRWLRMTVQIGHMNPILRWFRAENVDLRAEVTPVIIKKGVGRAAQSTDNRAA